MRMRIRTLTVATLLGGALTTVAPLGAQNAVGGPTFRTQANFTTPTGNTEDLERYLFTPELIMRHYREIGLEPDQREMITRAVEELQVGLVDLQWRLMEATQQLEEALAPSSVEQTRALALVDQVLAMEREVKTRHLTALIHIKNALTEEQQEELSARRGRWINTYGLLPSASGLPGHYRVIEGAIRALDGERSYGNGVRELSESLRELRVVPEGDGSDGDG